MAAPHITLERWYNELLQEVYDRQIREYADRRQREMSDEAMMKAMERRYEEWSCKWE